jgi:hypothetical protein
MARSSGPSCNLSCSSAKVRPQYLEISLLRPIAELQADEVCLVATLANTASSVSRNRAKAVVDCSACARN